MMKRLFRIIIIPLFLSFLAAFFESVILGILFIISVFYVVSQTKALKHHENLGLFFVSTFSLIPINGRLVYKALYPLYYDYYDLKMKILIILIAIIIYIVIFSLEEVIFVYIGQIIFKDQQKICLNSNK